MATPYEDGLRDGRADKLLGRRDRYVLASTNDGPYQSQYASGYRDGQRGVKAD